MKITAYRFGTIEIDGAGYTSDIIITSGQVIDNWRRKEGHRLDKQDLPDIIDENPDVLVVGTGYFGRMKVPPETRDYLEARGITVVQAKTGDAVRQFNKLQEDCARAAAAFHLTC